jgi:hypothetical protein
VTPAAPPTTDAATLAARLIRDGFVHVRRPHASRHLAWEIARGVFAATAPHDPLAVDMPELEVVGEFTVPPPGGPRRDYQALHIDFGLPVESPRAVDVARFTALHVDAGQPPTSARTRLVRLRRLLSQRPWVDPDALAERLRRYGALQHGGEEYVEGILARVIEAADASPSLPRAGEAGFLCGMEFASRADERAHAAERGLDLDRAEEEVHLRPGELLLFDNLATAHGRSGRRAPLELHQLCVGYRGLDVPRERMLVRRVLADAFSGGESARPTREGSRP